jgi:hypothetical protein
MPKAKKEVSQYTRECQIIENAVLELRKLSRPNVSAYCRDRNISHLRLRLQRRLNGRNTKSTRPATNKKLSIEQELALTKAKVYLNRDAFFTINYYVSSADYINRCRHRLG